MKTSIMTHTLKCPGNKGKCQYRVHREADWIFPSKRSLPEAYLDEISRFANHLMDEHGPNGIYFLIPTLEGKYEQ